MYPKTIIMFIACVGVFAVLLTPTLFKDRKRIIYNRDNTREYLVRYYLFLKDRKNFPFNFTLHKVMMSDESYYIVVLELGCFNFKRRILGTHSQMVSFGEVPGHIRFRKAEDLHYLELAKDDNGNEILLEYIFMQKNSKVIIGDSC